MLESLGSALKKAFDKIAGSIFLDKKTIDAVIKELQRALIQADVNVSLVSELSNKIRNSASDEKIKGKGIDRREHLIKLLHDELQSMLGKEKKELDVNGKKKIMMLGLYGGGKSTTCAKIALYYNKRGKKPCLLGLDVHRPAASEQLEQLGKKINIPVFIDKEEKNPLKIYKKFESNLKDYDLILIDTAGRHSLDKNLINEIKELEKTINPDYVLLVMPADIGQAAKQQASEFQKACSINGVIITRMDSSAKGGGALTACNEVKAPVFFIGTGEKMHDIETFSPSSFISRILGLGDLENLIEKVKTATEFDEKKQEKLKKKLEEGKFNLRDLQEQLKSMSGFSLSKLAEMIPGLGKAKIPENLLGTQEDKMKKWNHAIDSMTEQEIDNPEIIEKQTTRLGRIAKGSGTNTSDIRQLLKQYKLLKEMTKGGDMSNFDPNQGLSQKQMMKLAKKFGKRMRI